MQYSIIHRNATVSDFRLDAEAYLPIYLNLETSISKKSYTTFEQECLTFTKGIFDIKADCYLEKGGVPFIRISDLGEILLEEEQIINIPDEENNKNKKTYLKRACEKALTPNGKYLSIDDSALLLQSDRLNRITKLIESDKIKPINDKCYSFEQIVEAHKYVEMGHKRGNVAITVNKKT